MRDSLRRLFFFCIIPGMLPACQQAKKEGRELMDRSMHKAQKVWAKAVDKTFDSMISERKSSFREEFGAAADSLKVKEIAGQWIDFPFGYYYCFLQYKADKKAVLDYIAARPTSHPGISDVSYTETDTTHLYENLALIETNHPYLKKNLLFFYAIKDKKNLEYYACSRYPNAHILVFDPKTGVIYHHFERYAD